MSAPSTPRVIYSSDTARALIARWHKNPIHYDHLIRLANLYEDEEDPTNKFTADEAHEIANIFNETVQERRVLKLSEEQLVEEKTVNQPPDDYSSEQTQ